MRTSTPAAGTAPDRTGEPIAAIAQRSGIDRRTLLRFGAAMAGVLALPAMPFADQFAHAAETTPRLPVLWLNGQDCNGDSEMLLRASQPTPAELILNHLSLDYAELLMAGSGAAAHASLADTIAKYAGQYVLVVEGSIPTGAGGAYCCVGGRSFVDLVTEAAAGALAVLAVGSCAADGGLPLAPGGVTGAASVATVLAGTDKKIINFPGCPMNIENLTATLVQYLTLGAWPEVDATGKPLFAYGARIHPNCERLPFFRAGQFALAWGDAGHQAGWCLRYVGCQGPGTYANCATVKFNSGASFPITAGAPCLGCTRPTFWTNLTNAFTWTPPATTLSEAAADSLAAPTALAAQTTLAASH